MEHCLKQAGLDNYLASDVLGEISECLKSAPMNSILRVNTLIVSPKEALEMARAHFLQVPDLIVPCNGTNLHEEGLSAAHYS